MAIESRSGVFARPITRSRPAGSRKRKRIRLMRIGTASALGLTVLALMSSPVTLDAQRTAAAPREASVPFKVGETLSYDVSWSAVLVAGNATARVVENKGDAYALVVEGRPVPMLARLYNLYYRMESLLDSGTLLSQRGVLYSEEGSD